MTEKNLKIDLSSTALEKGIDLAKDFLGKLITPAIEEVGLLVKEKVTAWRFKNQVNTLNKAQEYCIKKQIKPKAISLKLLCPILENASLEEDEFLKDKWAVLLGNMVDSEQNIENHVFPFLLGQISKPEFIALEKNIFLREQKYLEGKVELQNFRLSKEKDEAELKDKIKNIGEIGSNWDLRREKWKLESELKDLEKKESKIKLKMLAPEYLPESDLKEFEIANLMRLGLIRNIPQHIAYSNGAAIRNNPDSAYLRLDDLEIEIENEGDKYLMTELGDLFVRACKEKSLTKGS